MDVGRAFLIRCPEDEDLVKFVEDFARKNGINAGIVNAIGTLKNARLGYFNKEKGKYEEIDIRGYRELLSAMGNISLKNGDVFVHIHVVLGDREGNTVGGHLIEGKVFVGEVFVLELRGEKLERIKEGSLYLWPPYREKH